MKRLLYIAITAAIFVAGSAALSAQVPAFRDKGYKGNVGIQTLTIYPGITTSHGYVFKGGVHYLGGGFEATVTFHDEYIVSPFIEYEAYILKRNSTPVVGVKLIGMVDFSDKYYYLAGLSPKFGWSWGIGSNKQFGIMPYIGIIALCDITRTMRDETFVPLFIPQIGVAFEF